ncbi:MAG: glycerol dehydratase reactivase beta/small subunit family protein [Bacillota bacterium]|nr:glycerol dehydratase reactivase beta/small subunit family protein [Bacillota bacterium]
MCVSPSFGCSQKKTMGGVDHMDVLDEISAGLEEEGITARFVKCHESSDLGVIGSIGSALSGSGISIGIQSKGTTVIHQKDLSPLSNLELFSQGPQLTGELFRRIGRSAGKYAKGEVPTPIPSEVEPQTRRFLVKSAMLHGDDMRQVERGQRPMEFTYEEVE